MDYMSDFQSFKKLDNHVIIQCTSISSFDPDLGREMARKGLHSLGWRQDQRRVRAGQLTIN